MLICQKLKITSNLLQLQLLGVLKKIGNPTNPDYQTRTIRVGLSFLLDWIELENWRKKVESGSQK